MGKSIILPYFNTIAQPNPAIGRSGDMYKNGFDKIPMLQAAIAQDRERIVSHGLYGKIKTLSGLSVFMSHHVFAVWDFMSLLKSLQAKLTCVSVPWHPVGDAATRFLINEIVVGEESDTMPDGTYTSHFELYLRAMAETGTDITFVLEFLDAIANNDKPGLDRTGRAVPKAALDFMGKTFDVIQRGKPHELAAVFTFGREDLIPEMFLSIVNELDTQHPGNVSLFKYYLDRHIEVDGGHHGQLALQMVAALCGDDDVKWDEALNATKETLAARWELWNAAALQIDALQNR